MKAKLQLGDQFAIPVDAATETFAILGRRGSGKTHTAVVMAEEMLGAGVQVVVLDPLDVWYGLRVSKDGTSAGIPIYVAGGAHADIPLVADAGKVIADVVVDKGLSIVLSLRHLSKSDQRRFVGEFGERLYDRKGEDRHRTALHVFIDEADAFVPQRLLPGGERCYGAIDTLVRRGRSSGIAPTLISQRPQVIAKDVLSQTEVLVAHQLTGPQDRKALEAWIEAHDTADQRTAFMGSLASLQKGTAWFWSPGLLNIFRQVAVRDRRTFDSSATPKPGAATVKPKAFAPVDLEALSADIQATLERAKADDPRELRKRIAVLEQELKSRSVPPPAPRPERVEVPVLPDEVREWLEGLVTTARESSEALTVGLGEIKAALARVVRHGEPLIGPHVPPITPGARAAARGAPGGRVPPLQRGSSPPPAVTPSNGHSPLPPGEKATLIAAAQYPDGLTREQASILTGYKRSSRDAYIQRLAGRGFVELAGGTVYVTEAGVAALGSDYEPLPTGEALQQYWCGRLPPGEKAIFQVLVEKYPGHVDRGLLDELTGYKRSSRDAYIQRLKARQLVTLEHGYVRAHETLFEA